jgi:anti-sigma B factor antagonist
VYPAIPTLREIREGQFGQYWENKTHIIIPISLVNSVHMNLVTNQLNGVTALALPGRTLDANNAPEFSSAVLPWLQPGANLILDMRNVEFVDSTGLGVLISCLKKAHGLKSEIKLSNLTKQVQALFELGRMHRVFEIFNSPEEAAQSYSS